MHNYKTRRLYEVIKFTTRMAFKGKCTSSPLTKAMYWWFLNSQIIVSLAVRPGDSRDFMVIVLYGGFIRVVISLGAKPLILTMSRGPRLDDGDWHIVEVHQELKVLLGASNALALSVAHKQSFLSSRRGSVFRSKRSPVRFSVTSTSVSTFL